MSSILAYLKRQTSPTISTVTADSLQAFRSANDVTVVGHIPSDDNASFESFHSLAKVLRDDYLFGVSHDEALAEQDHVRIPSIVVYKALEQEKETLTLTGNVEGMVTAVQEAARLLVVEYLPELHENFLKVCVMNLLFHCVLGHADR